MKKTNLFLKFLIIPLACLSPTISIAQQTLSEVIDKAEPRGVHIIAISEQNIPEILKEHSRQQIQQMKEVGYMDAPSKASVSSLDSAYQDDDNELSRNLDAIKDQLAIEPSNLDFSEIKYLKQSDIEFIGAKPSGGRTDDGWSGLSRLYRIKGIGLLSLTEWDYTQTNGGFAMIKEAVNQEINGQPAILSVQRYKDRYLAELSWADDDKIYFLKMNQPPENKQAYALFMRLAQAIDD